MIFSYSVYVLCEFHDMMNWFVSEMLNHLTEHNILQAIEI
jgi:hypothetical protein